MQNTNILIFSGVFKYDDVLRNFGGSNDLKRVEELIHIVQSDDPCNIQFTSVNINFNICELFIRINLLQGTTGNPKGATLTHHNVVNNGQFVGQRLGYGLKVRYYLVFDYKKQKLY